MTTTYFLNTVMGNVFNTKTTPALPATYYVGLSSTQPTASGTNVTEPSSGAYARVAISGLSEPSGGVITNGSAISFAESTTNWGTMEYFVIYDALTDGNLLMYGALTRSRTIEAETVVSLKAGSITLSLAGSAT